MEFLRPPGSIEILRAHSPCGAGALVQLLRAVFRQSGATGSEACSPCGAHHLLQPSLRFLGPWARSKRRHNHLAASAPSFFRAVRFLGPSARLKRELVRPCGFLALFDCAAKFLGFPSQSGVRVRQAKKVDKRSQAKSLWKAVHECANKNS